MPSPSFTRILGQSSGSTPTATRIESSPRSSSSSISEPPSAPVTPIAISSMRENSSSVSTVRFTDSTISWSAWSSSALRSGLDAPMPQSRRAVSGETTCRSGVAAAGKAATKSASTPASITACSGRVNRAGSSPIGTETRRRRASRRAASGSDEKTPTSSTSAFCSSAGMRPSASSEAP